jgi:hypothetical protein
MDPVSIETYRSRFPGVARSTGMDGREISPLEAAEWQAAMEALMLVATLGGPSLFARIGVMRALNRHVERVFDSSRKEKHWGRKKLARDR